jgi:hypothetical protein
VVAIFLIIGLSSIFEVLLTPTDIIISEPCPIMQTKPAHKAHLSLSLPTFSAICGPLRNGFSFPQQSGLDVAQPDANILVGIADASP